MNPTKKKFKEILSEIVQMQSDLKEFYDPSIRYFEKPVEYSTLIEKWEDIIEELRDYAIPKSPSLPGQSDFLDIVDNTYNNYRSLINEYRGREDFEALTMYLSELHKSLSKHIERHFKNN